MRTQSPVAMTSHGSASRSVIAGTRVTTAPSADLAEMRPITIPIGRISAKSALGAVVTRVPAVTDLDQDPCEAIATGDWVRIDNGVVEVLRGVGGAAPRAPREEGEK